MADGFDALAALVAENASPEKRLELAAADPSQPLSMPAGLLPEEVPPHFRRLMAAKQAYPLRPVVEAYPQTPPPNGRQLPAKLPTMLPEDTPLVQVPPVEPEVRELLTPTPEQQYLDVRYPDGPPVHPVSRLPEEDQSRLQAEVQDVGNIASGMPELGEWLSKRRTERFNKVEGEKGEKGREQFRVDRDVEASLRPPREPELTDPTRRQLTAPSAIPGKTWAGKAQKIWNAIRGPKRAGVRAAQEVAIGGEQLVETIPFGSLAAYQMDQAVNAELKWRLDRRAYSPQEMQTYKGRQLPDIDRIKSNIRWELHNGLPMVSEDAFDAQTKLYETWSILEPKVLPKARGFWEKLGSFSGQLAPFIAEMSVTRGALGIGGKMLRGVGKGLNTTAKVARTAEQVKLAGMGKTAAAAGTVTFAGTGDVDAAVQSAAFMGGVSGMGHLGSKAAGELVKGPVGRTYGLKAAAAKYPGVAQGVGAGAAEGAWFGGHAWAEGGDLDDIFIQGVLGPAFFNAPKLLSKPIKNTEFLKLPLKSKLRMRLSHYYQDFHVASKGHDLNVTRLRENFRRIRKMREDIKKQGADADPLEQAAVWEWDHWNNVLLNRTMGEKWHQEREFREKVKRGEEPEPLEPLRPPTPEMPWAEDRPRPAGERPRPVHFGEPTTPSRKPVGPEQQLPGGKKAEEGKRQEARGKREEGKPDVPQWAEKLIYIRDRGWSKQNTESMEKALRELGVKEKADLNKLTLAWFAVESGETPDVVGNAIKRTVDVVGSPGEGKRQEAEGRRNAPEQEIGQYERQRRYTTGELENYPTSPELLGGRAEAEAILWQHGRGDLDKARALLADAEKSYTNADDYPFGQRNIDAAKAAIARAELEGKRDEEGNREKARGKRAEVSEPEPSGPEEVAPEPADIGVEDPALAPHLRKEPESTPKTPLETPPGGGALAPHLRKSWELTWEELRNLLQPHDKASLDRARPFLKELYGEYKRYDYDPWGIAEAIESGRELPRVPFTELSQRHRKAIQDAVLAGEKVSIKILEQYPGLARWAREQKPPVTVDTEKPPSDTESADSPQQLPSNTVTEEPPARKTRPDGRWELQVGEQVFWNNDSGGSVWGTLVESKTSAYPFLIDVAAAGPSPSGWERHVAGRPIGIPKTFFERVEAVGDPNAKSQPEWTPEGKREEVEEGKREEARGKREKGEEPKQPPTPAEADRALEEYRREKGWTRKTSPKLMSADPEYARLEAALRAADRRERAAWTRADRAAERQKGIDQAKAGEITHDAIKYAPVDTLPPGLRRAIQAEAVAILETTESDRTRQALLLIKMGAGKDKGSVVEEQKERIVDILSGDRDQRTLQEKDIGAPERPPTPLVLLYLARDPEAFKAAVEQAADAVVDNDLWQDDLAREADAILEAEKPEGAEFGNAPPDIVDFLYSLIREKGEVFDDVEPSETPLASPEIGQPPATPPKAPPVVELTGKALATRKLADEIQKRVEAIEPITWRELFAMADKAFGGTQGQGTYGVKDAYDAMELAVNQMIRAHPSRFSPVAGVDGAIRKAVALTKFAEQLPTQTKRDEEMISHQQFSTPPAYAYAAAWLANIKPGDVMLEPSAGVGGMAVFGQIAEAEVHVNELAERRRALLDTMDFAGVTGHDAELIHILLPKPRPTVVVMNPPFSQTAGRMKGKKMLHTGARHVTAALKSLKKDGRLVVIVGRGMTEASPTFRDWFERTKKEYTIRGNVGVSGDVYKKYGTHFATRLLVIDKSGPHPADLETVGGEVDTIIELINKLEAVRDARPEIEVQGVRKPLSPRSESGGGDVLGGSGGDKPGPVGPGDPTDVVGGGKRPDDKTGAGPTDIDRPPSDVPRSEPGGSLPGGRPGGSGSQGGGVSSGRGGSAPGTRPPSDAGGKRGVSGGGGSEGGVQGVTPKPKPEGIKRKEEKREKARGKREEPEDTPAAITEKERQASAGELYEPYKPEVGIFEGSQDHPAFLVQSAALASVKPPPTDYTPNLPKKLITSGELSDIQLEAVVLIGRTWERTLPSGEIAGFLLGDDPGVGKTREVQGAILDQWNRGGTKKVIWLSAKKELFDQGDKDWKALGGHEDDYFRHADYKLGMAIPSNREGILFTTYDRLIRPGTKTGDTITRSRMEQILDWVGPDFDGVLVFDEAHKMGNLLGGGRSQPSQTAEKGVLLQAALPKARVVYMSATMAVGPRRMGYAQRLGLWGKEAIFADFGAFIERIEGGGLSAMEQLTRDLKATGRYIARSLAFQDREGNKVEFSPLEHPLTEPQIELFNEFADAWQLVHKAIRGELDDDQPTEGKVQDHRKSTIEGRFRGAQQRFFNQILISMQMPTVFKSMDAAIARGEACVVQIVNTYGTATKRILDRMESDDELPHLDLTPREGLINLINSEYPVEVVRPETDENNNTTMVYVMEGTPPNEKPVLDPEKVARRDALIEKVGALRVPAPPLDAILERYGIDNVAEVTGRTKRVVLDPETGQRMIQPLSQGKKSFKHRELNRFQDDDAVFLIMSGAGSTGMDAHADLNRKNQRKRNFYSVQPGWSASEALQHMGRVMRSNQAHLPRYFLCTTDVPGHKRFTATIASRLEQLGAMTTASRQTGGRNMFDPVRDDLTSDFAARSLLRTMQDIARENIPDVSLKNFYEQTGIDPHRGGEMDQFLNRLLGMRVASQHAVFDRFGTYLDAMIQVARENGTLDVGVEDVQAKKIEKKSEKVIFTDDKTGAKTNLVKLKLYRTPDQLSWERAEKWGTDTEAGGFFINEVSDVVWAATAGGTHTDTHGTVEPRYYMLNPTSLRGTYKGRGELEANRNMKKLSIEEAEKLWKAELAKLPEFEHHDMHILTGAILPIWDRLPRGMSSLRRALTDKGEQVFGVLVDEHHFDTVMENLGVDVKLPKWDAAESLRQILDGATLHLSDGLKLQRARVSGQYRVELSGWEYARMAELKAAGAFPEVIAYNTRLFLPYDDPAIFDAITKSRPVVKVTRTPRSKGGAGGSGPLIPPSGELLKPYGPLTREQRQWIHERIERGEPYVGLGGMLNTPVKNRGLVVDLYDRISANLQAIEPTTLGRQIFRWFARGLYGNRWAIDPYLMHRFRGVRGVEKRASADAGRINRDLTAHLKALQAKGVAKTAVWRPLEDALRGKIDRHELDPVSQKIFDNFKRHSDALTDEMLELTDAHPWIVKAGGLENWVEIVEWRRQQPGTYLRRLYKVARGPLDTSYRRRPSKEPRMVGPRIKAGMFKGKRSDEGLYTVNLAVGGGKTKQFFELDLAAEFFEREIANNLERYGQSVYDRVKLLDPIGDEIVEEQLQPIEDVRVLMARTLVDMAVNLESIKLQLHIHETVIAGKDLSMQPGTRELPNTSSMGILAGKSVPEAIAYNLMAIEEVRTGWLPQMWGIYNSAWKMGKVPFSPSTWGRNMMGMPMFFWPIAGLNPITQFSELMQAIRQNRDDGPQFRELVGCGVMNTGYAERISSELYKMLEADPSQPVLLAISEVMQKVRGVTDKVGAAYDYIDQISKLWAYLVYLKEGMSTVDAQLRVNTSFPNYEEPGTFADWARKSPIGAPFTLFPDQSIKIAISATRDRWGRLMGIFAMPGILTLISSLLLGLDDDDLDLLNGGWSRKAAVDRYFQPILPWLDKNGRPQTIDLRWIMPLANDYRVETGPGGVGIPYLLSQPPLKTGIELMMNREEWTGQNIAPVDEPLPARFDDYLAHAFKQLVPLPSLATRGIRNIVRSAQSGDEGRLLKVILKEMTGINIKAPRVSRKDAFALLRQKGLEGRIDSVRAILDDWNAEYRRDYEKPITVARAAESIRQAKKRQMKETRNRK